MVEVDIARVLPDATGTSQHARGMQPGLQKWPPAEELWRIMDWLKLPRLGAPRQFQQTLLRRPRARRPRQKAWFLSAAPRRARRLPTSSSAARSHPSTNPPP